MCRRILFVLAAATLALPASASAQAPAYSAPCGPGANAPVCQFWTGKVTFTGDGDTLSVDIDGSDKVQHVRVTGINAMEEHAYTDDALARKGDCHAGEATDRLHYLVEQAGGRVRLAAQDPTSTSRGRLRRAVAVLIHGKYRDIGRTMLIEGHALPLPTDDEWAWNVSYEILSERAAAAHRGLWDPSYCGDGPDDGAKLKLWANWDAPGPDRRNPNGEYVKIKNLDGANAISLAGWWVRDSGLRRYTFPPAAVVPPGGTITVYVGAGTDDGSNFFWNLSRAVFGNVTHNGKGDGDGAYLFDPQGDLREYMQWPCHTNCHDQLEGKVKVSAAYKRSNEYVSVANVSKDPVDLEGYRVDSPPYGYTIGGDSVLDPGQRMRIYVKGDPAADNHLERGWGLDHAILSGAGDKVRVLTLTDILIDCQAWGTASC
jgi:endonuclease YncB( thermonuclease family)